MKRKWFLGFLVLVGMTALGQPVFAASARQASLTSMSGQVEWLKAGTSAWKAAQVNQKLENGDKIRTDEGAQATLVLDDGSTLQLSPGSEFAIQGLTKDAATDRLETTLAILKGRVKAEVTPLQEGSKFEIETPVLVAAVRGTTYSVGVNPDGSISVTDEDGNVVASGSGEPAFKVSLDNGDDMLVTKNPAKGEVRVRSVGGTFTVVGPDGSEKELNPGDEIVFSAGGATFIPTVDETTNAPGTDPTFEPPAGTDPPATTDTTLSTPPSQTD